MKSEIEITTKERLKFFESYDKTARGINALFLVASVSQTIVLTGKFKVWSKDKKVTEYAKELTILASRKTESVFNANKN